VPSLGMRDADWKCTIRTGGSHVDHTDEYSVAEDHTVNNVNEFTGILHIEKSPQEIAVCNRNSTFQTTSDNCMMCGVVLSFSKSHSNATPP